MININSVANPLNDYVRQKYCPEVIEKQSYTIQYVIHCKGHITYRNFGDYNYAIYSEGSGTFCSCFNTKEQIREYMKENRIELLKAYGGTHCAYKYLGTYYFDKNDNFQFDEEE